MEVTCLEQHRGPWVCSQPCNGLSWACSRFVHYKLCVKRTCADAQAADYFSKPVWVCKAVCQGLVLKVLTNPEFGRSNELGCMLLDNLNWVAIWTASCSRKLLKEKLFSTDMRGLDLQQKGETISCHSLGHCTCTLAIRLWCTGTWNWKLHNELPSSHLGWTM